MNDDQVQDLKDFIATTVRNEVNNAVESRTRDVVREEIGSVRDSLHEEIVELRQEMRDGFEAVAEAISGNNDQLEDHETRISKLEQKAA